MKDNLKKWICFVNIIGCLQFIIITAVAMLFYKGGTYIDPSTSHYLFWYNYFSDLGRVIAHSGVPNTISFVLFTITLNLWGLFQIPFFYVLHSLFKQNPRQKKLSLVGSILGGLTGVFYIGIAFTPSDVSDISHNLFVLLGFGSIYICIILYTLLILKNKNYPNLYGIILLISAVILSIYFIFLAATPGNLTSTGLLIHVVGQKFMIYTLLLCGIIQSYGVIKQLDF
ncbi:MAG: hypothetical protein ACFFCI_02450 [Promethearchaeota archaeon]